MTTPDMSKAVKHVSDEKARGMFSGDAAGPANLPDLIAQAIAANLKPIHREAQTSQTNLGSL